MSFRGLSCVLCIVICGLALATHAGAYAVNPETFDGYGNVADWSDSALYGWTKSPDCNAAGRGEIGDFGQQGGKALRLQGAWPFGYVWQCCPSKVKYPKQTVRFEFRFVKGMDKNILAVGMLTRWADQTAFMTFNADNGVVTGARFTRIKPGGAPSDQEMTDLSGKETMKVGQWYKAELNMDFQAKQVRARFGPVGGDFFEWTPWAPIRDVRQPSGALVQGLNVDIDSIGIPGAPVMSVDRPVKGWTNTLKPKGKPGSLLTLASGGRTSYRIVIGKDASSQERKAAADLSMWLRSMTDAEFRVVSEGADFKSNGKEISVGRTQTWRNATLATNNDDLGREGYAIAVKGDTLFLWGGITRGPINAVYALLEEDLGCRWYAGKTATIPRNPDLAFRPVPRRFIPTLEIRDPGYLEAGDPDWQIANRVVSSLFPVVPAAWGGNADYAMFVHTYFRLLPPAKYFKEHPEYYSMLNGERRQTQVCATHPQVARLMSPRVKEILRQRPNSRLISVSPNDGTGYCECPTCKALDDAEGTKAASMLTLVNRVADAIKGEFPHVRVSTLAYNDTVVPPKTIRPRPNVAIQFCTDAHAWPHPYLYVTQTPKVFEALKGWSKIGADIHICDYTCSYGHYLSIMPNMPVVSENMKTYRKYGAKGILLLGSYNGFGENALMRCWVWAKQMWDPTLDTRALMKDFCHGYYGKAGKPMWEYNQLLWKLWESNYAKTVKDGHDGSFSGKTGKEPGADFFTKEFRQNAARLFGEAERLAGNAEILRRVKYDKVPLLYVRISKELGYHSSPTVFFIGDAYKRGARQGQFDECRQMIDELEEITKREDISRWDEHGFQSRDKTIPNWRNSFDIKVEPSTAARLGDAWRFKLDPKDEGVRAGWYKPEAAFDKWSEIRSDWNGGWEQQGYGDYYGVAWYAQRAIIPGELAGTKHLYLMLRSPGGEATIFINGVEAHERGAATGATPWTNWALPLAFDAAKFLKPGGENRIVVRINRPRVHYPSYMRGVWGQTYVTAADGDLSPDTDPGDTEKLWLKLWLSTQANLMGQK